MANPILSSDLYKDDGALKVAIEQLQELQEEYKKAMSAIKKDAAKLQVSISKVNATTTQQREEIKKTSTEADALEKQQIKLNKAYNKTTQRLEELREITNERNRINKLEAKLTNAKTGSYKALSAQLSLNKKKLQELTEEERNNTKAGKDLVKETNDLNNALKRMDSQIGVSTRNVGNYKSAFDGLPAPIANTIQGLGSLNKAFLKLLKNPIALAIAGIVVVLKTLFDAFKRSQAGSDFFGEKMAQAGAIVDVVTGRLASLASAAIELFSGNFSAAADKAKEAFTGVADEIKGAIDAASEFYQLGVAIEEEQIQITRQTAKLRAEIKGYNKVAEDTTKDIKEREAAAKKAIDLSRQLLNAEQSLAVLQADRARLELESTNDANKRRVLRQKVADADAKVFQIQESILELQTTQQNKLNIIRQEGARKVAEALKAEREEREKLLKHQEESVDRLNTKTKQAQTALLESSGTQSRLISKSFSEGLAQSESEIAEFVDRLNTELETATGGEALTILEKLLGAEEALQAAIEFKSNLQAVLSTIPQELEGVDIIPIKSLNEDDELKKIGDQAKAEIAAERERINKELAEGEKGTSIYDLLGINVSDPEKEAIKSSFDFAKQQLLEFANFRVQIAQQNVNNANNEVAAAQRALQAEIDNRNAGYAHKVETAQKELNAAKATQERALREQEKAQKRQQQLQTIQQAVNLITASSKIFQQVGNPIIAIPLIALMFGSFIAAKVKANQLSKKKFRKGTFQHIDWGGSHDSGNDIPIGLTKNGKQQMTVEKGEAFAVFNKTNASKYRGVLPQIIDAINTGTFESLYQRKAAPLSVVHVSGSDMSRTESELSEIRKQGETRIYTAGNKIVEITKNVRRVYHA